MMTFDEHLSGQWADFHRLFSNARRVEVKTSPSVPKGKFTAEYDEVTGIVTLTGHEKRTKAKK